ncbi:hypothetical protein M087_0035 [Bacteroides fragilis str. S23 R14]|nr:hypothetical protein M087_0035 [Bacteroides fragilis str. S23 R14]
MGTKGFWADLSVLLFLICLIRGNAKAAIMTRTFTISSIVLLFSTVRQSYTFNLIDTNILA